MHPAVRQKRKGAASGLKGKRAVVFPTIKNGELVALLVDSGRRRRTQDGFTCRNNMYARSMPGHDLPLMVA